MSSVDSMNHFFKKILRLAGKKLKLSTKKRLKKIKFLEETITICLYSISTNVMLVPDRARRTLSIILITCSSRPPCPPETSQNCHKLQKSLRPIRPFADSKSTTTDSRSSSNSTIDYVPR